MLYEALNTRLIRASGPYRVLKVLITPFRCVLTGFEEAFKAIGGRYEALKGLVRLLGALKSLRVL